MKNLKSPENQRLTLGALKSPGSNESQGGGGLKLLPGAIGLTVSRNFCVAHV